jgi:SAM-dependent methyltransferase
MRALRLEAYGEDIGQHSWVTADDLRGDAARLRAAGPTALVDLGCGPCGPLTFLMKATGCSGIGLELSGAALVAARRRAESMGLADRLKVHEADLDYALPIDTDSVEAAIALDVVLHLRDRSRMFAEVARILVDGGRFLFTDAGVVTGVISSEEVAMRSAHALTQFSAAGFNERMLSEAGLELLETEDRTPGLLSNARGRFDARSRHRGELEQLEGSEGFLQYQRYLQTIISLSERGALSRIMYLAEVRPGKG